MKILDGKNIADYIKNRQFGEVRELKAQNIQPKLLILRNSTNPVITKYVNLKKSYGEDIGVIVEDKITQNIKAEILAANQDPSIAGIIVQLPLENIDKAEIDEILNSINPAKDVDGLGANSKFDSATATAINWLIASYNINLKEKQVAVVGRGRLVGGPLINMWEKSGISVQVFDRTSLLTELKNYDVIVTATGVPHLIKSDFVKIGATIIDAGTASEDGKIVGDTEDALRDRTDLAAITPKIGGVGPLTIATLFDHVIFATTEYIS